MQLKSILLRLGNYALIGAVCFISTVVGVTVARRLYEPPQVFIMTADRAAYLRSLTRETGTDASRWYVLTKLADCVGSKKDSDEFALSACKRAVASHVEAIAKAGGGDDQTAKAVVAKAEIEMENATVKLFSFEADRFSTEKARIEE